MSLYKREIAAQIAEKQVMLGQIYLAIANNNYECDHERDYVHSLRLKAVVLESEIDQLQKKFTNLTLTN